MAAPTRVTSSASAFNTSTSPKTVASIAVQAGDLIAVSGGAENANTTLGTPTSTGLTFTLRGSQTAGAGTQCSAYAWTAPIDTTATISVSCTATGGGVWGYEVSVWRGHGGVGNVFSGNSGTSSTAPSGALTTTGANSAVDLVCADWNASLTAPTYRSIGDTPVQDSTFASGATYAIHCWHNPDGGAAGAKTVGISAPTMRWVMVGVEILGATSGTAHPATGTAVVTTAASGSPVARMVATGAVAVLTAASGAPAALRPASGTNNSTTSAAGAPTALHPATATTPVTTTAAGAPVARHPATGAIAVTTTAAGSPGVLAGSGSLAATGVIPVVTSTSGTASQRHAATGAATVTTSASGAPTARHTAAGACGVVSTAAGSPSARYVANGTVIVVTSAVGTAFVFDPSIPQPLEHIGTHREHSHLGTIGAGHLGTHRETAT